MKLQQRIHILAGLGDYLSSDVEAWKSVKQRASLENSWFLPEFIDIAVNHICSAFLDSNKLQEWVSKYNIDETVTSPKTVGIVMAGNIPLVGFHDFISVFISGHKQAIKLSSKDSVLLKHIVEYIISQDPAVNEYIRFEELLKNCDAYIATGSNNSARYFEQYFARFPHIIRRNRTSIAILDGTESNGELAKLADDIQLYFGLGCRNVTKIYIPAGYDFVPLLEALRKYDYFIDQHKYKNNYDCNLTIQIMNNRFYMTNESLLMVENTSPFSPIGELHYEFYTDKNAVLQNLNNENVDEKTQDLQCIVGKGYLPFGKAQFPSLSDYADGIDTLEFLTTV